jgi:hypothetical protein
MPLIPGAHRDVIVFFGSAFHEGYGGRVTHIHRHRTLGPGPRTPATFAEAQEGFRPGRTRV